MGSLRVLPLRGGTWGDTVISTDTPDFKHFDLKVLINSLRLLISSSFTHFYQSVQIIKIKWITAVSSTVRLGWYDSFKHFQMHTGIFAFAGRQSKFFFYTDAWLGAKHKQFWLSFSVYFINPSVIKWIWWKLKRHLATNLEKLGIHPNTHTHVNTFWSTWFKAVSGPDHTMREKFENASVFPRLSSPSTLICREMRHFQKRSLNPWNSAAFRFSVDGKYLLGHWALQKSCKFPARVYRKH